MKLKPRRFFCYKCGKSLPHKFIRMGILKCATCGAERECMDAAAVAQTLDKKRNDGVPKGMKQEIRAMKHAAH